MARIYNTFEFIGEAVTPNDKSKLHRVDDYNGNIRHSLGLGISKDKMNTQFLSMDGWIRKENNTVRIFTKGENGEKGKTEYVPFENRFDEDVLDRATNLTKIVVDLEQDQEKKEEYMKLFFKIINIENRKDKTEDDLERLEEYKADFKALATERYEFLSMYDVIVLLESVLQDDNYKGVKFRATGNASWSTYNGKIYRNFVPSLIEIVDKDTPNKLEATVDIYFHKDSIEDMGDEKKVYINGFVSDYDRASREDRFFPQQFVIDGSKLDFDNDLMSKYYDYLKGSFNVRGRNYYHLQCLTGIVNGAEILEGTEAVSYDTLTKDQQMQIDLGLSKLSDFAPKGEMIGEQINEIRIIKPLLDTQLFADGAVEFLPEDEFASLIIQDDKPVDLKDLRVNKEEKANKEEPKQEAGGLEDELSKLLQL